jgi:hypothetical protein
MLRFRPETVVLVLILTAAWAAWGLAWFDRDLPAVVLAAAFPAVFALPVVIAHRARHRVLTYFSAALFITHGLLPLWFYLLRDTYTYSGWRAVKDFRFGLDEFLAVYWRVGFLIGVAVISCLVLQKALWPNGGRSRDVEAPREIMISASASTRRGRYGALFILLLLAAGVINHWMYQRGLALTGFTGQQTALPFKLGGLLYYGTRLAIPAAVFLLYRRTSRSVFITGAAVMYAGWAGMSQLSRMTFVLLIAPILYFALADQRKVRLILVGIILLIGFQWITAARSIVYIVSETAVEAREVVGLRSLLLTTAGERGLGSPGRALYAVVARVGGPQEVVLGHQYDTPAMGGPWRELSRQYLGSRHVSSAEVQRALFGFVPPVGYSVGGGGFMGRMLMIASGNVLILMALGVVLSVFLTWGEILSRAYQKHFRDQHVGDALAGLCVIVLYAFGDQRPIFLGFFVVSTVGLLLLSMPRALQRLRLPITADRM